MPGMNFSKKIILVKPLILKGSQYDPRDRID